MAKGEKPASRTRAYSVRLTAWESYQIRLKAADEAAACRGARNMWLGFGPEPFRFLDGGIQHVCVVASREDDD
jgi:hypothetical protein